MGVKSLKLKNKQTNKKKKILGMNSATLVS